MAEPKFVLECPVPLAQYPKVLLAHGGGGRLMNQLIAQMFLPAFGDARVPPHDAATIQISGAKLAFTTDSFVVKPLFFPGGDIGSLSVNGTVNDLAMAGAQPLYLSAGFILEEGLPMETLWRVVQSMRKTAAEAGVRIVTGDTKVVDRGKGDGLFINTAGVGVITHSQAIGPAQVKPGDEIIVNGDLGRHGIAVMAQRQGLEFETAIESDMAPLHVPVAALLDAGVEVHCLRDLTRGGLASALNEIAEVSGARLSIDETKVPVHAEVRGACEILGFDPFYVANEGRFVAFVKEGQSGRALEILRGHPLSAGAALVGKVSAEKGPLVTVKSQIGTQRVLDMLSGEQQPRIC